MRSNLRLLAWATLGLALTVPFASCDDDKPYEAPTIDEIEFTPSLADSIWSHYMTSPFQDATEVVPSDIDAPDYEDYYETWLEGEETRDVIITFSDDDATWSFEDGSKKTPKYVKISKRGAHLTIRNDSIDPITGEEGRARMNYILKGKSDNGSIRIYSNKKFMVTLDGVSLRNAEGPAISAQKAGEKKRMFVYLADGTRNTLCDADEYTNLVEGEDDKGTLFSEGKMIFCGKGELHVVGRHSHAIAADDRIRLHAGITLVVDSARKDGIHCNDAVVMTGGLLQVFAHKDALQADTLGTKGLTQSGGRMLLCGKRAVTAAPWSIANGASFCLISKPDEALLPDNITPQQFDNGQYSVVGQQ